jgi:hypothetical protein
MLEKKYFLLTRINTKNLHISIFITTFAVGITGYQGPEAFGASETALTFIRFLLRFINI